MKKRKLIVILTVIAAAAIFLLGMRFVTPEDAWICDHGQWVKHGQPSRAMPTNPCP